MGRYDLMLYKLVKKYGIFLRGHAHMTTPSCRKILSLASPRQKFLVTPLVTEAVLYVQGTNAC